MSKRKIFVLTGPTAIGKSDVAVEFALKTGCSVISADSMQVYRGLNIGTGKITHAEMRGVPHYMLDVANPDEEYSVGRYVSEAEKVIEKMSSPPIVVGGTGLYITSLVCGNDFGGAGTDDDIREKWKSVLEEKGKEYVYEYLKKIDPPSAAKISINDTKRVIRAIEIFEITGRPKSQSVAENNDKYESKTVILYDDDRDVLYKRINDRVDKMFASGLIDEVESLIRYENCRSMQAIGYKEVAEYLKGRISKQAAIEQVKQNSRNYAKRQLTYFKGMKIKNKEYVKYDDFDGIFNVFSNFKYYV
ncbi:MAG: tRNA (adenosine(37)-N6)-dimethylallyltransferase MiaA [Firmicutes bacterium]|nr:tRNA (adenosine(37)-N6)-dimethylallyltransferase MiaA [Bacillota bacterium]MDY5531870.1 tRNA (adenosine(37)-N6)-dimethylallyltransferase MiaA [Pumilibacteraceae bacterium]